MASPDGFHLGSSAAVTKFGHIRRDCPRRKAWFEKKGIHFVSVCFESNLIEVPNYTWWLDSGATTHVSHVTQGFLSIQPINERMSSCIWETE